MNGRAQLRRPSLKRSGVPAHSGSSLGPRVLSHDSGISQRKKVKFSDMEKAHQESSIKQSIPCSTERIHAPNANKVDEAKTLEYRSFKRLREETCSEFNPNSLPKKDNNLKASQASDCIQELNSMNSSGPDVHESSPLVQKMPPRWFSPTPKSPPKFDSKEGGLFSLKRESIYQFASAALSRKINDLKSNRLNLIHEFLERLGIKGKSSNLDARPSHKKSDGIHLSPISFNSNHQHEYKHEILGTELIPANTKETKGEYLFPCNHGQIDKFILPSQETVAAEDFFPSAVSHSTQSIFETPPFPSRQHASEAKQMQSQWVSDIGRVPYPLLLQHDSTGFEGLNTEFGGGKHETKFTSPSLNNFGIEQSLVPYVNPDSLEVSRLLLAPDLHWNPEGKQCDPVLLGWRDDDDIEAEAGVFVASNRLRRFEPDHLALIPCTSPGFLHQTPAFNTSEQGPDGLFSSYDNRFRNWEMDFDRAWP
ncbi:hypothetical protein IHE45_02G081300 [Dioscorea alata]|uniref:Uncharacterized protein n=1 Tax=Dioscorea alata TaxID=55571 RepID=A0ACB7WRG5_DIOAL|nr:hypothetical protein IHE45_02G081300 [Dioscorea alata]